jgi:hypothetical protein
MSRSRVVFGLASSIAAAWCCSCLSPGDPIGELAPLTPEFLLAQPLAVIRPQGQSEVVCETEAETRMRLLPPEGSVVLSRGVSAPLPSLTWVQSVARPFTVDDLEDLLGVGPDQFYVRVMVAESSPPPDLDGPSTFDCDPDAPRTGFIRSWTMGFPIAGEQVCAAQPGELLDWSIDEVCVGERLMPEATWHERLAGLGLRLEE